MARTALIPQNVTSDGLDPVMEAANIDGHSIPLRRGLALVVSNDDVAPTSVTIPTPGSNDGNAIADKVISVPNGDVRHMITIGTKTVYRQSTGVAHIDISPITSVTVALVEIP